MKAARRHWIRSHACHLVLIKISRQNGGLIYISLTAYSNSRSLIPLPINRVNTGFYPLDTPSQAFLLDPIQPFIKPLVVHQFLMSTFLSQPAFIEHDNLIRP